ncbi:single-stranded DNA-binding protein [Streptomyces sp. NPDC002896]|uniref:single-stranded DNA-binding protein n=1 Tax=Streptomyces sp. NPDC002896 TaxID=3154438 RepID=UPI00331AC383
MNETMVTVVGNVATTPVFRELPTGSVARFRLAVTARHRDRVKENWVDGHTNFFTVCAWRSLGANVMASVNVGDPVIVQGRLKVRHQERDGGQQWMSADIDALAIGHDMSRGTSDFRRGGKREAAQAAHGVTAQSEAVSQGERSPTEGRGEPAFAAGTGAVPAPEPVFEAEDQLTPQPASVT